MALNRFLSTDTGSIKVEVTNALLPVASSGTANVNITNASVAVTSAAPLEVINDVGTQLTVDGLGTGGTVEIQNGPAFRPLDTNLQFVDSFAVNRGVGNVDTGTLRVTVADDDTNLAAHTVSLDAILLSDDLKLHSRVNSTAYRPVCIKGHHANAPAGTGTAVGNGWAVNTHPVMFLPNTSIEVVSSSGTDGAAGAGAQTVTVNTINSAGVRSSQTGTIGAGSFGSSAVVVESCVVASTGANNTNAGIITVQTTVGGTKAMSKIGIGECISQGDAYFVAEGKTFYPLRLTGHSEKHGLFSIEIEQYNGVSSLVYQGIWLQFEADNTFDLDLSTYPPLSDAKLVPVASLGGSVNFTLTGYEV